jgi:hypothetical protein
MNYKFVENGSPPLKCTDKPWNDFGIPVCGSSAAPMGNKTKEL